MATSQLLWNVTRPIQTNHYNSVIAKNNEKEKRYLDAMQKPCCQTGVTKTCKCDAFSCLQRGGLIFIQCPKRVENLASTRQTPTIFLVYLYVHRGPWK